MKKKIILVSLFLLILFLKPYININYSNDTLNDNIIGSYTFGYTCGYCSSGSHTSCNWADRTTYSCGRQLCCCGRVRNEGSHTYGGTRTCNVNGSTDTVKCTYCPVTSSTQTCTHSITVTVTAGTGGTATGGKSCKPGSTVSISATPNTGYSFSKWTTTGGTLTSATSASTSVKTSNANITVTASFTINSYTLTVNPNGGTFNNTTGNSTFTQNYNTTKTLETPTISNYTVTFDETMGTCATSSLTNTRAFSSWSLSGGGTIDGNTYTYGASNGTLTANYSNSAITLPSATASEYTFLGWYDAFNGGNKVGDAGGSYTPTSNITLYARWTPLVYTVTLSAGSNGSIYPSGTHEVTIHGDIDFYVIPNKGYKISDIKVDNVSIGTNETNTITNITANRIVNVTFVADSTIPDINKPLVSDNMVPVKWDGAQWEIVSPNDVRWYNYSNNTDQWANMMLRDGLYYINDSGTSTSAGTTALANLIGKKVDNSNTGSLYVWIPRYSYKISSGNIDLKWSIGTTDYTLDGYNVHPAFRYAGYDGGDTATDSNYSGSINDLTGLWIAKYDAKKINTRIGIRETGTKWTNETIGTMFTTAKNMVNGADYQLSTTYFETHLLKNVEWGAIAYLQKYSENSTKYNVMEIDKTSSYSEYVAGYNELLGGTVNYNVNQYGSSLRSAADRFVDIIKLSEVTDDATTNYSKYKEYYGNAVGETSSGASGTTSWNSEDSVIPETTSPFIVRTGRFGYTSGTGAANSLIGFRTALVAIQEPVISKYNVAVETLDPNATITGINSYTPGTTVTVKITPSASHEFANWKVISGGVTLSSSTSATITFTMPSNDVLLFADSRVNPDKEHILSTYIDGIEEHTIREVGETITLTAEAANGKTFTGWTAKGVTISNATATTITITMPDNDVMIVANFT